MNEHAETLSESPRFVSTRVRARGRLVSPMLHCSGVRAPHTGTESESWLLRRRIEIAP